VREERVDPDTAKKQALVLTRDKGSPSQV